MLGLRRKLLLGFGGLLLILLVVSGLSIAVLAQYSQTLDRFLFENYRSVGYGQAIKDSLDVLDRAADRAIDGTLTDAQRRQADDARAAFEKNLALESQNVTLHPREDDLVAQLQRDWKMYKSGYEKVMASATRAPATGPTADAYRNLQQLSTSLRDGAQEVITINLNNMVAVDGQVKRTASAALKAMFILTGAGAILAGIFIAIFGRGILRPLRTLTDSAKEIERGNLDLVVRAHTHDELGQLAEAFNSMAAKLREFRRSDQARLVRTQQTTQLAIDSLPDAVAVVGPDGRVEMANKMARRLFRLEPQAAVQDVGLKAVHDLYEAAASQGRAAEPHGYELAIQVFNGQGEERFFLPHAIPIHDVERQLIGVTLVLADVTRLRKLDELKSGLLSTVSHELKTPLTSVRMGIHLLLEERVGALTPKQQELLMAAGEDADRLHKIVENLLDLGRMESGRVRLDIRPMPVRQVVSQSAEPLEASFQDKGVALKVDLPDDVPDVLADEARIGHVLTNLLTNALKYTNAGGEVTVSAAGDGNTVRFSVQDNGRGIPEQYLGRIFERFFRVPGQAGQAGQGGAGLGLAIAKEIVDAHGGRIWVQSKEGQGSTFSFTLQREGTP